MPGGRIVIVAKKLGVVPFVRPGHRVVQEVQATSDVVRPECDELVEMGLHVGPRPMQRMRRDGWGVDEPLVGHQGRAGVVDLERAVRASPAGIAVCFEVVAPVGDRRLLGRLRVDEVDVQLLEHGSVRVLEPDVEVVALVHVPAGPVRREVPRVVPNRRGCDRPR